jgi:P27 family predicted phage terminase small subunit
MRGRKPIPNSLKLLRNNPGRRPINANEPKPEATIPPCPPHLDNEAHREWRRMTKRLVVLGLMTQIDRAAMAAYCQAWSRWCDAEVNIRKFGAVVESPNKFPVMSPYLIVANMALKQMRAFLTEFGMTPSSRSRLDVAAPQPKLNPFEEFRHRNP